MKKNLLLIAIVLVATSMPSKMYAEEIIVHENGNAPKKEILKTVLAIGGGIILVLVTGGASIYLIKKYRNSRAIDDSYTLVEEPPRERGESPLSNSSHFLVPHESLNKQLIEIIIRSTTRDQNQEQLVQDAEMLISQGADVNALINGHKPLLIEAVQSNRPRMVQLLLENHANPDMPILHQTLTPLDWAFQGNMSQEVKDILRRYGAQRSARSTAS